MICVWVYGCDPGRVSDGSRLALYQTLSIERSCTIFFWHVLCVIVPFFLSFLSLMNNQNAPRPSEYPSQGGNVKTFRWDHRLQIQNIFMTFKRVPRL